MTRKNTSKLLAIAATGPLYLTALNASAAGFQLSEYSATGLGRAYAGEAAIADNAASQWRNPALLSFLEGTQVSGGAIYVDPNIDIDGTYIGSSGPVSASSEDYIDGAVIPNIYLSHQINKKWAIGLAAGSNYGMNSDLGDDFEASPLGDSAEIITSEVNLNLAYMLTSNLSIGGGLRYVMAEGSFGSTMNNDANTTIAYVEGETEEWGWQIGAAWQINENNSLGLTYKSEVDLDLEGDAKFYYEAYSMVLSDTGSLPLTLPATAELAYTHQATEKLQLSTSFNWTDWSTFEELMAELDTYTTAEIGKYEGWEDSFRFAVGAEYLINPQWTVRSGLAYDISAVSTENRTATIPETDRYWISAGAGYSPNDKLTIDLGMAYILSEDASLEEQDDDLGYYEAETEGSIFVAGIQASYKF